MSSVEELLRKEDVYFLPKGKDLLVCCLSPEHDDSSPSMRIDRMTGIFGCFSCGFKGNIFEYYGQARDIHNERIVGIKRRIREIISSTEGLKMPEGLIYINKSFRGLPKSFLREFEAFYHDELYPDRLVFPLKDVNGIIKAFIGRRINSDAPPKYTIEPAEADVPLYPARIKPINSSLILVEGIYDMLNLHHKGCTNAVCSFGTTTLSERTVVKKLSHYRMQGVSRITILYDGDASGRTKSLELKEIIKNKTDFSVEVFNLPDGLDPGDMTQEQVDKMVKKLYDKEKNVQQ